MSVTKASTQTAAKPATLAEARTVESVHRSTTFHWVGNGFHVSTYFPSEELPAERVSPFVLMDYGPPKEFSPLAQRQARRRLAPAPRLRDGDAAPGRARSPTATTPATRASSARATSSG